MSHIRSKNTKPEQLVRQYLWHRGFRYRLHVKNLPGTPDIVLSKYQTVIFVHGCFWHGHKDCRNASTPKTNANYWKAKIARNQQRDQEVWRQLEAKGLFVIIVWECQLEKALLDETLARVEAEILRNGEAYRFAQEKRRHSMGEWRLLQKVQREKEAVLKAELRNGRSC